MAQSMCAGSQSRFFQQVSGYSQPSFVHLSILLVDQEGLNARGATVIRDFAEIQKCTQETGPLCAKPRLLCSPEGMRQTMLQVVD